MNFPAIAIVGRGCVLPGANDPAELWDTVVSGAVRLTPFSIGRSKAGPDWSGADPASTVFGHVTGFEERFDPNGLAIDAEQVMGLDPTVRWVMHATRQALAEVGRLGLQPRAGLVLGNISCPTTSMTAYAEDVWLRSQPAEVRAGWPRHDRHAPIPASRFCFGLPAQLVARAFELRAGAVVLEAACASVLYAIELACRKLSFRQADLMVAGALNGGAPEIISHGMGRLGALSPSGRSRPFHRDADGLVPAEGTAMVALMRLEDALAADVPVLGVIRGIGATNDGGRGGMLVPDGGRQQRAMSLAYQAAGIDPKTVSLLECHATGTAVGDTVEAGCAARIFAERTDLPVGSVKGNLGHPLTAASGAALLKVLGAMEHGTLPPTVGADEAIDAMRGTPLRPLARPEEWRGLRRAAVSGFGFGGVNAHLVVDAWNTADRASVSFPGVAVPGPAARRRHQVAVVGLGARVGDGDTTGDFVDALLAGEPRLRPPRTVELRVDGLRMPPNDMLQTSGEHLLVLEAARDAARALELPEERTMVLVGVGAATVHAEFSVWHNRTTLEARRSAAAEASSEDRVADPLNCPPWSLGGLGNIAANRISAQLRLTDHSVAVCAEEASGIRALDMAVDAIGSGASDAALVGAVDLASTVVHRAVVRDLGLPGAEGNAAVVLALKRLDHARRDGDPVLAVIEPQDRDRDRDSAEGAAASDAVDLVVGDLESAPAQSGRSGRSDRSDRLDPSGLFGRPHCAAGLLSVACATVALYHRSVPTLGGVAVPRPELTRAKVSVAALGAPPAELVLNAGDTAPAETGFATLGRRAEGETPARRLSSIAFFDLRTVLRLQEARPARELVALPAARAVPAVEIGAGAQAPARTSAAVPVPVPVPATAMAAAPPPPPTPSHVSVEESLVPAALSAHQRLVGRSHLQFLNARHENHLLFLEMQQRAARALLEVASAFRDPHPSEAVVPVPHVPQAGAPVPHPVGSAEPVPPVAAIAPVRPAEPAAEVATIAEAAAPMPTPQRGPAEREFVVSPDDDPWVLDHCPTWTLPVLPMMCTVDHLFQAASTHTGLQATGLRELRLQRWIPVVSPTRLATRVEPIAGRDRDVHVSLLMWRPARNEALSRFELVAEATITFDRPETPAPLPPLTDAQRAELPYLTNRLPHGPAFQYLTEVGYGSGGAVGILDARRGSVPGTFTHPGLLDAATHIIADRVFWLPYPQVGPNVVPYPHGLVRMDLFAPFPTEGQLRVEARPAGAEGDLLFVDFQVLAGDRLCAAFRNVSMVSPPSVLELQSGADRRAFLLERRYAPAMSMSQVVGGASRLDRAVLEQADWPTGGLAYVYGLPAGAPARLHAEEVAMREHVARAHGEHPARVVVDVPNQVAWMADQPDRKHRLLVHSDNETVTVENRP
ncbi:beta-ketoacyl synthase N-terminal-like domain-containing protein [Embleya sp. NPDC050154]|uniref:hotdog fold thioesterase n=1 Tax=Embleya sp. NPDC050154 TaxID=3363988 RepID=UPI0037AB956F